MIMRLRQPDRRRFKSPIRERRRRVREYYYASVSVLVVKVVLFIFLCVLFSVSLRLFRSKFPNTPPPVKYTVPVIVAIFAAVLGYYIYKNIKDVVALSKEKH